MVYELKSRAIVWRPVRCLRLCDRLSNPPSVMLSHLIRANKMSHSCHCSLRAEVETNSMESYEMLENLC